MCRTYQWFLVLSGLLGNTDTLFSALQKASHKREGLADGKKGGGDEVHLERRWAPGKCSKFLGSGVRQRRLCSSEAEKSLLTLVKKFILLSVWQLETLPM